MSSREWLALAVLVAPAAGVALVAAAPRRHLAWVGVAAGVATAAAAVALAAVALADPGQRELGRWVVVDPAGGLLVGVIGIVGLASAVVSPQLLAGRGG